MAWGARECERQQGHVAQRSSPGLEQRPRAPCRITQADRITVCCCCPYPAAAGEVQEGVCHCGGVISQQTFFSRGRVRATLMRGSMARAVAPRRSPPTRKHNNSHPNPQTGVPMGPCNRPIMQPAAAWPAPLATPLHFPPALHPTSAHYPSPPRPLHPLATLATLHRFPNPTQAPRSPPSPCFAPFLPPLSSPISRLLVFPAQTCLQSPPLHDATRWGLGMVLPLQRRPAPPVVPVPPCLPPDPFIPPLVDWLRPILVIAYSSHPCYIYACLAAEQQEAGQSSSRDTVHAIVG